MNLGPNQPKHRSGNVGGANFARRRGLGLIFVLAYPVLKFITAVMGRKAKHQDPGIKSLMVYQAYQVGDLFMALPALEHLAKYVQLTVIVRPDCEGFLQNLGQKTLPFANPFFSSPNIRNLTTAIKNAWALRNRVSGEALDLDADPRSGFFLKVAGAGRCTSYRRPFAWLFDATFPIAQNHSHQMDKNWAVAEGWLRANGFSTMAEVTKIKPARSSIPVPTSSFLLLSCWTRKPEKNWPLEHWEKILVWLLANGPRPILLDAPDGDSDFQEFRSRWEDKVEFLKTDLDGVLEKVRSATGVICTDNFLGHMAGYLDKPVLWINGSSDPEHVSPQGSKIRRVQLDPMPCRPCGHRCVNPIRRECLLELKPVTVEHELRAWLAEVVRFTK